MSKYILITEKALDYILMSGQISDEFLPVVNHDDILIEKQLSREILGYFLANESDHPFAALINKEVFPQLKVLPSTCAADIYRRIARVVKGLKTPPIHLPRQWSEYHYKNLLAFFAVPKNISNFRWVAESNGINRCIRLDILAETRAEADLEKCTISPWPPTLGEAFDKLSDLKKLEVKSDVATSTLTAEVDLKAIGSTSIVGHRTYEEWMSQLSEPQRSVLDHEISSSIRIVGPAGSGKTLALCMRAIQTARSADVRSGGKRILVATHSWAMAERIDSVLSYLAGGESLNNIVVLPLLSLLQEHAGHIGSRRTDVIGDDSTDGRNKSIDIVRQIISFGRSKRDGISEWISAGLNSEPDGRARLELITNLYEEISGVLTASAVSLDDQESIEKYLRGEREDWMPPFLSRQDRGFVIGIYREFLRELVDRSSITTDQFVLDSIRVLETFAWRMKKETEGYDFIFVDELQLFDAQERAALELLGRGKKGVPFITAEDPSQGVFSAINSRKGGSGNDIVYLDTVHRFNNKIFNLISFIYQKFPLNSIPLRIDKSQHSSDILPKLYCADTDGDAVERINQLIDIYSSEAQTNNRICVATLGDFDEELSSSMKLAKQPVIRLNGFDDVEQLAYSKRSIVVAPWQYIGGIQFSHVIVVCAKMSPANTQFGKRRELTSVYLSCSRAADVLSIVCSSYIPSVVAEARDNGYVLEVR